MRESPRFAARKATPGRQQKQAACPQLPPEAPADGWQQGAQARRPRAPAPPAPTCRPTPSRRNRSLPRARPLRRRPQRRSHRTPKLRGPRRQLGQSASKPTWERAARQPAPRPALQGRTSMHPDAPQQARIRARHACVAAQPQALHQGISTARRPIAALSPESAPAKRAPRAAWHTPGKTRIRQRTSHPREARNPPHRAAQRTAGAPHPRKASCPRPRDSWHSRR